MNQLTFNFCGADAITDFGIIVNNIKFPIAPEITENVQDLPGMYGKLFLGNTYGQKIINIDITIPANNEYELMQKIDSLTDLVITFGDEEYPMVFSNDSAYTYYGHFSGLSTPEEIIPTSHWRTATLTFSCSDPKGYAEMITSDLIENPVTILPEGQSETYPVFTCMPNKDVTKIALTDEDGVYVYVGGEVDPDSGDLPVDNKPRVIHDPCNTLATWTTITNSTLTWSLDNGVIGGVMRSTTDTIKVGLKSDGVHADFGDAVKGKWHGPCVRQYFPDDYSDFEIKVRMYNRQVNPRARGKCEAYLLDRLGNKIGYFSLKDNGNSEEVKIRIVLYKGSSSKILYNSYGTVTKRKSKTKKLKLGTGKEKVTVKTKGKKTTKVVQQWKTIKVTEDFSTSTFTDFYGYISLKKVGNKFTYEIMKLDENSNPAWKKPITKTITDTANKFTSQLAGVAFYTAKYDINEDKADPVKYYTNNKMALCDLKVWNILNGGTKKIPVIARSGDEIKINCEDRTIYKNGEIFMSELYIGSDWPDLQGGVEKVFAFEPDLDSSQWYMEYRPTKK